MNKYSEQVYSGVLGKILGVYLGRPIEGWSYDKIQERFKDITTFVHHELGNEIIEPDDDISGTFGFIRNLENHNDITYENISDYWRNILIENKTIFWWGGLFRSTEHTAYYRLKQGYDAPKSGSSKLNGKVCATQIGSQIFIDGYGLINPNNPKKAYEMALKQASVSHDLVAMRMAGFLAALEAIVFEEKDMVKALRMACDIVNDDEITAYVEEMIELSHEDGIDYHRVHEFIEDKYPYSKFGGVCPAQTNFLIIIILLLIDDNNFLKAISMASSIGYDTDCNAGNIGCIEGIRLGLKAIDESKLRELVNERMLIVTAIGSRCFNNATSITNELLTHENHDHKYTFDFKGSTCGFEIKDGTYFNNGGLLELDVIKGTKLSQYSFFDPKDNKFNYSLVGSPNLYFGQSLITKFKEINHKFRYFIEFINKYDEKEIIYSDELLTNNVVEYKLPENKGYVILNFGLEFLEEAHISIESIEISGKGNITYYDCPTMSPNFVAGQNIPSWYYGFIDTTSNSQCDRDEIICLSHLYDDGLLYTGSNEFKDYKVISDIILTMQKEVGIIAYVNGLNRYYALRIVDNKYQLVKKCDKNEYILKEGPLTYYENDVIHFELNINNHNIEYQVNDIKGSIYDDTYDSGAFGLTISEGTSLVRLLKVE